MLTRALFPVVSKQILPSSSNDCHSSKVGRWVPHELTDRQQDNRKIVCEMLLARYKHNLYIHRIVTGDEKWIYFENLKRNRSYVDHGQPSKSTARPNRFGRKIMLCIFWVQEGPIYY
ncbi:mariner Mos1 transposase [Trichonephila clavipes]|nr:mariner Mos1 transposase [Trichonephila clavipes]